MSNQKSLLKNVAVGESGKLHGCRRNKEHKLPKGATMLVIKEDRKESHYCPECGGKFIANAQTLLAELENKLLASA